MPTVLGAGTGATVLLTTPAGIFEAGVPFLIAGSSLLLLGQPWIVARAGQRLLRRIAAGSSASRGPTRCPSPPCARWPPHPDVFAMANPAPELRPEEVRDATGVFRGALDVRASTINEEMKLAAARALAGVIAHDELHAEYIIPSVFNRDVAPAVAAAVAEAAMHSGVAQSRREPADQPAGR